MKTLWLPFLSVLTLFALPLLAQEPAKAENAAEKVDPAKRIEQLITDGLAAWRAGDGAKSAELLQRAVGLIQQQAAKTLATLLPKEVPGWKLEEPSIDSGTWGTGEESMQWTNVELHATRDEGEVHARLQITNSPQIYQGYRAMVQAQEQMKSLLRQQGQDIDIVDRDGFKVLTVVNEDQATAQAIGNSIAVFVEVDGGDRKLLEKVLGWVDLGKLAKMDKK